MFLSHDKMGKKTYKYTRDGPVKAEWSSSPNQCRAFGQMLYASMNVFYW